MSDGSYTNSQGDLYNAEGVKIDSVTPSYPTADEDVSINPVAEPEPFVISPNTQPQDLPAPDATETNQPEPEIMESDTAPVDASDDGVPWSTADTVMLVAGILLLTGIVWWLASRRR